MTVKELKNKRSELLNEMKSIRDLSVKEKRAFTDEEREKLQEIKSKLEQLASDIDSLEVVEAEEAEEAQRAFKGKPVKRDNDNFTNFIKEMRNGKFTISTDELQSRATVTTATNPQFKFTDVNDQVSLNGGELVLESLGAVKAYFDSGNVLYPSLSNIVGSFGTEDNTVADQALVSASQTLVPSFVSASIEVSKSFVMQSKPSNMADLKNALIYAIEQAIEKRALTHLTGATNVTGTTNYGKAVDSEAAIIAAGTGYVAGRQAVAKMKKEIYDAGSGAKTWANNEVNGYPAKRSILTPNDNQVYYGDFKSVVKALFGEGITIEMVTDGTMARKGNVLLIASAMADAKCTDFNKVAKFTAN